MPIPDLFALFALPLQRAGLRYMVSGSLASVHYGEPRVTLDIDLVVHLAESEIATVAALFPETEFYLPPSDVIALELKRPTRGHFNVIHLASGQKADFYPSRNHPYWAWAWEHRKSGSVAGMEISFAPLEYVVLWKLEFYRESGGEKHLRDIRGMLSVTRHADVGLIEKACGELGLAPQWKKATEDIGE